MLKKIISFTLMIVLAFGGTIMAQADERPEDAAKRIAKAKAEVAKLGTSAEAGVKVKLLSGIELKGRVVETKDDEFTVNDQRTEQMTAIRYQDVARVKKSKQGGAKVPKGLIIGGAVAGAAILSFIILRPRFKFGDLGIKLPPCLPNCPPTP